MDPYGPCFFLLFSFYFFLCFSFCLLSVFSFFDPLLVLSIARPCLNVRIVTINSVTPNPGYRSKAMEKCSDVNAHLQSGLEVNLGNDYDAGK